MPDPIIDPVVLDGASGFLVTELRDVHDRRFVELVATRARFDGVHPPYDVISVIVPTSNVPAIGDYLRLDLFVSRSPNGGVA
jgi:hypothetical protein